MSPPLQGIHLFNYRNFTQHQESFHHYHSLFKGRNAVGKTNLLEAISFLCPGTGFRKDSMANFSSDFHQENLTSIEYKFLNSDGLRTAPGAFFTQAGSRARVTQRHRRSRLKTDAGTTTTKKNSQLSYGITPRNLGSYLSSPRSLASRNCS